MSSSPQHRIVGSSPSLHQVEAVKKQRRFSGKSQQSLGVIEVFLGLPNLVVTLWLWLTVRHGIDGPNRNRWFTELNSMVIFHGYVSHNQMVNPHGRTWFFSLRNFEPKSPPSNSSSRIWSHSDSHRWTPKLTNYGLPIWSICISQSLLNPREIKGIPKFQRLLDCPQTKARWESGSISFSFSHAVH